MNKNRVLIIVHVITNNPKTTNVREVEIELPKNYSNANYSDLIDAAQRGVANALDEVKNNLDN